MPATQHWKERPEDSDYAAATRYLSLLVDDARSQLLAHALAQQPVVRHRANDLLRASGLGLLPQDDPEVKNDLKKIKKRRKLAPVLLLRGEIERSRPMTIVDGYHRVCASYHIDEDADIPCLIVSTTE